MILLLLLSPSLLPEEDLISAVKYSLCNEEGATKNKRSGGAKMWDTKVLNSGNAEESEVSICNNHLNMGHNYVL